MADCCVVPVVLKVAAKELLMSKEFAVAILVEFFEFGHVQ